MSQLQRAPPNLRGILGCAGDRACPIPISHCPAGSSPILCPPTGVSGCHGGAGPVSRSQIVRFPKGRSCLPSANTAPHSLGMNGGIVLVGDRVININYAKQPLQPTLASTTFQDWERRKQSQFIHRAGHSLHEHPFQKGVATGGDQAGLSLPPSDMIKYSNKYSGSP